MKVRTAFDDASKPPLAIEGVRNTLITDSFENPVVLVRQLSETEVLVLTAADDPDFHVHLASLGIHPNHK